MKKYLFLIFPLISIFCPFSVKSENLLESRLISIFEDYKNDPSVSTDLSSINYFSPTPTPIPIETPVSSPLPAPTPIPASKPELGSGWGLNDVSVGIIGDLPEEFTFVYIIINFLLGILIILTILSPIIIVIKLVGVI